jgi:hypothetical protein
VLFNLLVKLQSRFPTKPDVEFGRIGLTITFKESGNNFVRDSLPKLAKSFGCSFYLLVESQLTKDGSSYASRYTTDLFQSLERYRQSLC